MKNKSKAEEPSRADWARRIRERSGLSRRAFGEKYGINPKTIEAWEYGYGNRCSVMPISSKNTGQTGERVPGKRSGTKTRRGRTAGRHGKP